MVADTCRYSSGLLIPIFQTVAVGIKGPLEYLQMHCRLPPLFLYFLFIWSLLNVQLQIFPYSCLLKDRLVKAVGPETGNLGPKVWGHMNFVYSPNIFKFCTWTIHIFTSHSGYCLASRYYGNTLSLYVGDATTLHHSGLLN